MSPILTQQVQELNFKLLALLVWIRYLLWFPNRRRKIVVEEHMEQVYRYVLIWSSTFVYNKYVFVSFPLTIKFNDIFDLMIP